MPKRFAVSDERLLHLLKDLSMDEPTEIQEAAIPAVLDGGHVLVIAPTGIGKTEAAILPIMDRVLAERPPGIACLYITPLRALNRDLMRRLTEFGARLDISIGVRHGDTPQSERTRQAKAPPQILITTPETFQILFLGRRLREHLRRVRWVIIDEIHELAEDERGAQLSVGLARLTRMAGEYQRIGLSATVGDPGTISSFLGGSGREVKVVKVNSIKELELSVDSPLPTQEDAELAMALHTDDKHIACMRRARELIEQHRSTLFFVNTRDTAEALGVRYHVWDEGLRIGVHHGSLSKDIRVQMEEEFKAEKLKALICTSSLELGIDIGSADFAIQFNSPRQVTRLIQRVGRSGHRAGMTAVGGIIATEFTEMLESAVICRRAIAGELERVSIRRCPISVLANQIAAMCMTDGRMQVSEAYATLREAYPFLDLTMDQLRTTIQTMNDLGVIGASDYEIRKTGKTMRYFYSNISMIPDERTYRVVEVSSRRSIGTLDESFVATSAEPYSAFVTRGRAWRVVEVGDDEILVEEIREIAGTPSWVGEDIPVPFEVAQEVGRLRASNDAAAYLLTNEALDAFRAFKCKQRESGADMPSDRQVVIEVGDGVFVMHACFGTKVNETLAKLIASLISTRLGESIGVESGAYAILLQTPRSVSVGEVEKILRDTRPESLGPLMRIVLRSSGIFKWQFMHVAKKFGAIEKGADIRSVNISRIMDAFEGSVIFEEALDKTLFDNLDIRGTSEVLRGIQEGGIVISTRRITPLGAELMEEERELMLPRTADRTVLMALKNRLLEERVILHCLRCGAEQKSRVKNLQEKLSCRVCGGVMLTLVRPYTKGELKVLKKRSLDEEGRSALRRLHKSANLIMANGRKAVLALVARGVGPDTAARLLQRFHRDEEEFLRDILAAEVQYARTRRFWE